VPRGYEEILRHARKIKDWGTRVAKISRSNPHVLIEYLREKWGFITTYLYEDLPIDYEKISKKLVLANIIAERYVLRKYKNLWKHLTIAIVGLSGGHKTTYAVLSYYGALKLLGYSDEDAYSIISKYTFFDATSFVKTTKYIVDNKLWVPALIVDDVGVQINKYWIFLGETYWVYLFSVLDQLKDWTGCLILTAKNKNSIPSKMREIIDLIIDAKEIDIEGVVMSVLSYYLPNEYELSRRRPVMIDIIPPIARIPDKLWSKMIEVRYTTSKRRLELIDKVVEKLPEIEENRISKIISKIEKQKEEGEK